MADKKQYRICTEILPPKHQQELDELHAKSNSPAHAEVLRAAFYKKKQWPKDATIRIAFMDKGKSTVKFTPISDITNVTDQYGNKIKPDPLFETIRNMTPEEAVKKVVRDRIQPNVGTKLMFVDSLSQSNVRVSFDDSDGAWSFIGTDCLLQDKKKATIIVPTSNGYDPRTSKSKRQPHTLG